MGGLRGRCFDDESGPIEGRGRPGNWMGNTYRTVAEQSQGVRLLRVKIS